MHVLCIVSPSLLTKANAGSMGRRPRIVVPDLPHHIIQRGQRNSTVFRSDADFVCYRNFLLDACIQSDCQLHAYVLMPDHVHLVLTPPNDSAIARCLQLLGRLYVRHFNAKYRRTGGLWDGRYKSNPMEPGHWFLASCIYVETNPVRWRLAARPQDYPWCSYHRNAYAVKDPLITEHRVYANLGTDLQQRCRHYRALFGKPLTAETVMGIRRSINGGWLLGSDSFSREIECELGHTVRPLPRGGDRRSIQFIQRRRPDPC